MHDKFTAFSYQPGIGWWLPTTSYTCTRRTNGHQQRNACSASKDMRQVREFHNPLLLSFPQPKQWDLSNRTKIWHTSLQPFWDTRYTKSNLCQQQSHSKTWCLKLIENSKWTQNHRSKMLRLLYGRSWSKPWLPNHNMRPATVQRWQRTLGQALLLLIIT